MFNLEKIYLKYIYIKLILNSSLYLYNIINIYNFHMSINIYQFICLIIINSIISFNNINYIIIIYIRFKLIMLIEIMK